MDKTRINSASLHSIWYDIHLFYLLSLCITIPWFTLPYITQSELKYAWAPCYKTKAYLELACSIVSRGGQVFFSLQRYNSRLSLFLNIPWSFYQGLLPGFSSLSILSPTNYCYHLLNCVFLPQWELKIFFSLGQGSVTDA